MLICRRQRRWSGELEYGGIVDTLKELDRRFKVRQETRVKS